MMRINPLYRSFLSSRRLLCKEAAALGMPKAARLNELVFYRSISSSRRLLCKEAAALGMPKAARLNELAFYRSISSLRRLLCKEAAALGMPKAARLPEGFAAEDIKLESSICTGEKTIGFYDRAEGRLRYAELVRDDGDIAAFYKRYGLTYKGEKL